MDQDTLVNKGVCRCLFGPVDHDDINNTLSHELETINLQHQARWNFDFQNERPLEGNYVWSKVGGGREQDEGEGRGKHKHEHLTGGGGGGGGSAGVDAISTPSLQRHGGLSAADGGAGVSGTPPPPRAAAEDDLRNQQVGGVHHHRRHHVVSGGSGGVAAGWAAGGEAGPDGSRSRPPTTTTDDDDDDQTCAVSTTTTTTAKDVAAAAAAGVAAVATATVTSPVFTVEAGRHSQTPNSRTISTSAQSVPSQCGNLKRKPKHITGYMAQKKKSTRRKGKVDEPDG